MSQTSSKLSKTELSTSCLSSLSFKKLKRSYRIKKNTNVSFVDESFDIERQKRRTLKKEISAAILIQKVYRGYSVRKRGYMCLKKNSLVEQISRVTLHELDSFLFRDCTQAYTFSNEFANFEAMNMSRFNFMEHELPTTITQDIPIYMYSHDKLIVRVFELVREITKQGQMLRRELEIKDDLMMTKEHTQNMIAKLLAILSKNI